MDIRPCSLVISRAPSEVRSSGIGADDYEFASRLGGGGEADVYRVKCRRHNREYAAKRFRSEELNSTTSYELAALSAIDHPNVIRLYDHFQYQGRFVLVYELCRGGSLMDELRRNPSGLGWRRFMEVARQLVAGLAACHAAGVSHGDVKPENVLFRDRSRRHAVLTDFGHAQLSGVRMQKYGTPDFASPELRESADRMVRRQADRFAADVWALGVVFLEMLLGEVLWDASQGQRDRIIARPAVQDADVAALLAMMLCRAGRRSTIAEIAALAVFSEARGDRVPGRGITLSRLMATNSSMRMVPRILRHVPGARSAQWGDPWAV